MGEGGGGRCLFEGGPGRLLEILVDRWAFIEGSDYSRGEGGLIRGFTVLSNSRTAMQNWLCEKHTHTSTRAHTHKKQQQQQQM